MSITTTERPEDLELEVEEVLGPLGPRWTWAIRRRVRADVAVTIATGARYESRRSAAAALEEMRRFLNARWILGELAALGADA